MTSGLGSEWIARKLIAVATLPPHLLPQASRDLLCGMGSSAPRYVATWMGRAFEGGWIHVCMAEALCCAPGTSRTLLIGGTPI